MILNVKKDYLITEGNDLNYCTHPPCLDLKALFHLVL